jgi:hypothetical protein
MSTTCPFPVLPPKDAGTAAADVLSIQKVSRKVDSKEGQLEACMPMT